MLEHYVQVRIEDLHPQQNGCHATAHQDAKHTKAAEEVQRPVHVPEQEADGQQVEDDAEGASDAVVAFTPLPGCVFDGNFTDRCAIPTSQRGDEAVHFTVERNTLDDLASIRLEGGAKVVD